MRAFTFVAVLACGCSGSGHGSPVDAGLDGRAEAEAGKIAPIEASTGGDGGCPTPASVAGFTPPAYAHARQQPGACMTADFAAFDTACVDVVSGSIATCDQFRVAHPTCYSCLVSNLTDSTWGPLVVSNAVPDVNVAGCLELTDTGALPCAMLLAGALECQHAACDAVCPATDIASLDQYELCVSAVTGPGDGCAAPACLAEVDAAAASPCLLDADAGTDSLFLSVAPVFCGGSADAGP